MTWQQDADGVIWYSTPKATVGLVVKDGIVVDSAPYARRWALGCSARQIWDQGIAHGHSLKWLPMDQ